MRAHTTEVQVPITHTPVSPEASPAQRGFERETLGVAACPLCHTAHPSLTAGALAPGGWHCARCGQHWDAARLAHDAAYAAWVVKRNASR
jgi:hypothetical protein